MPQPNAESQPRPEPAPETLSRRARPIDYQPTEDDVHLLDFVRTLYKRLWTAATAFLVIVLSVAVYSFTATPIYEATGKLLIETAGPNVLTFQEVIDEGQITADYYQTQYDLLQSRSLARTTLDRLNLWDHHEFGGEQEGEGLRIRDVLSGGFSSVAQAFRPAGVDEPIGADETLVRSEVIDAFLDRLRIDPVRNSRVVNITFHSSHPRVAADSVNALSHAYIEQNLEFKFMSSQEASDWLTGRLEEQRTQVEATEAALQRYREEHAAVSLEDRQNIVVQRLADLNAAVTLARTEKIGKEARYRQLTVIQDSQTGLDTFPDILANTFIQQQKAHLAELEREAAQLAENLGERHPEMLQVRSGIRTANARLQGEIAKVVESVRNEFMTAQARERSMMAELEAQKAEALAMNRTGIEYGVLTHRFLRTRPRPRPSVRR